MRKIVVIGISILSVFILCSLSYQPIIADTPIEQIVQVKKSKASDLDVDELKELYNRLIEFKSQSKDGCGCSNKSGVNYDYPYICDLLLIWLLNLLFRFLIITFFVIAGTISNETGNMLMPFLDIKLGIIYYLGNIFYCNWFEPLPDKVIYGIEYKSI